MSIPRSSNPLGPRQLNAQDGERSAITPRQLPRCGDMIPPALPHVGDSLKAALGSGCVETVNKLLLCDNTLVHVPFTTLAGCELPVIAAIRMGCCAAVAEVLLRHRAVPTAHGRCGASALHIIAWGVATTCPQLQMRLRNAEQQGCDIATCLLQYGADTAEKWKGLLPAEAARQSGQEHLANIIEHFVWWRAQLILAKHRAAATRAKRFVSPLLQCKANVYGLISEFVAPPLGVSTVQTHSTMLA